MLTEIWLVASNARSFALKLNVSQVYAAVQNMVTSSVQNSKACESPHCICEVGSDTHHDFPIIAGVVAPAHRGLIR